MPQTKTDPYAEFQKPATAADPYAEFQAPAAGNPVTVQPVATPAGAGTASPHPVRDWVDKTFANNPGAGQPGGYAEALRPIGNMGRRAVRGLADTVSGLGDVLTGGGMDTQQEGEQQFNNSVLGRIASGQKPSTAEVLADTADQLIPGVPLGSKPLEYIRTARTKGPVQALSDMGGDALALFAGGKLADSALEAPGALKRMVAGDVDRVPAGATITPRGRYNAAQRLGVNLDAADATGSPLLGIIKRIGENSLFGGHLYDNLKGANTAALSNATEALARTMSPLGPEEGGHLIQADLRKPFVELQNRTDDVLDNLSRLSPEEGGKQTQRALQAEHARLKRSAAEGFQALTERTGGTPLKGAPGVGEMAQGILDREEPYFAQFPSFRPGRTMSVLEDVSGLANPPSEYVAGPGGRPYPPSDWSTMHRLGSDIHSLYAENPDLIKTRAQSWLQALEGKNGEVLRDASGALTPELRPIFDKANADWATVKGTYDNPQSPFYNAIRTDRPSDLAAPLGGTSPEATRALRAHAGQPAVGVAARGLLEKTLGRAADGEFDLGGGSERFARIPEEDRNELFGGEHQPLKDIFADYREVQPFEKAAYTANPEELATGKGLGPQTAGGLRNVRDVPVRPVGAEGPILRRIGQEGMGALQRGVFEDLLGKTKDGGYNFPRFAGNLERLNPGYRGELFGSHQNALADIAHTSNALARDFNPSGSAKLGQKVAEAAAIVPTAGAPLLQYPAAKLMTSPRVVDWLMRPTSRVNPFVAPAAVGAAMAGSRQVGPGGGGR